MPCDGGTAPDSGSRPRSGSRSYIPPETQRIAQYIDRLDHRVQEIEKKLGDVPESSNTAAILCRLCSRLEREGNTHYFEDDPDLWEWWEKHKQKDRERWKKEFGDEAESKRSRAMETKKFGNEG